MESDDGNANAEKNIYLRLKAYLRNVKLMRRCAFVRFKLLI